MNYLKLFFQTIENVKSLTVEITTLRNKLDSAKKKAEIAHENVHDLHISLAKFIETKQIFQAEVEKRLNGASSKLLSSSEALKQANAEKSDVSILKIND